MKVKLKSGKFKEDFKKVAKTEIGQEIRILILKCLGKEGLEFDTFWERIFSIITSLKKQVSATT